MADFDDQLKQLYLDWQASPTIYPLDDFFGEGWTLAHATITTASVEAQEFDYHVTE